SCLPTQDTIVLERFFDEVGGMQLVLHSPYGSRINRAWGLALRKRFCRKFNFELQAAATEDNIVLSLTTAHSFELAEVVRYLNSASVRGVLVQALLDAPMFTTRWRWVAGVSLALPRFRGGRKVPPQLARMDAEDLIASIFPDQVACAANLVGERELPDHPLIRQAIADSLGGAVARRDWRAWSATLACDRRVALVRAPHARLWIAAERLTQFRALWPEAPLDPAIAPPDGAAQRDWPADEALTQIVRSRLEGLGPATQAGLAEPLGLEPAA